MAEKKSTASEATKNVVTESTPKVSAEAKTTPSARDEASANVFAKDYLAYVDDSKNVPTEIHDRNKRDVVASALSRGLLATAEPTLSATDIKDERSVLFTYSVTVKPNNAVR